MYPTVHKFHDCTTTRGDPILEVPGWRRISRALVLLLVGMSRVLTSSCYWRNDSSTFGVPSDGETSRQKLRFSARPRISTHFRRLGVCRRGAGVNKDIMDITGGGEWQPLILVRQQS